MKRRHSRERPCAWETGQTLSAWRRFAGHVSRFGGCFLKYVFKNYITHCSRYKKNMVKHDMSRHWCSVQSIHCQRWFAPLYSVSMDKHPNGYFSAKIAKKFTIFNVKIADQKLWSQNMGNVNGNGRTRGDGTERTLSAWRRFASRGSRFGF